MRTVKTIVVIAVVVTALMRVKLFSFVLLPLFAFIVLSIVFYREYKSQRILRYIRREDKEGLQDYLKSKNMRGDYFFDNGQNLLSAAAAKRVSLDFLLFLIEYGSDPNRMYNRNKDTILHYAARHGNIELAEALIKKGAFPNCINMDSETPLMTALKNGFCGQMAMMLLKHGADARARDKDAVSTLMIALEHGASPETVMTLSSLGADLNAVSNEGLSVIHYACFGMVEPQTVGFLLKNGSDVNCRTAMEGQTPLMIAARYKADIETVKLLLTEGADPKLCDNDGKSALEYAEGYDAAYDLIKQTHFTPKRIKLL